MTTITWLNQGTVSPALKAQLETLTRQAADYINGFLARPINFDISMNVDNSYPRFAGNAATTSGNDPARPDLWEGVGIHQARTGTEVNGYDTQMTINQAYLEGLFLDATPGTSNDLPAGKTDGFSVLVHEMMHGLGFVGWTDWSTYQNTTGYSAPYDYLISVDNGRPYFVGETAMRVHGGAVPLTAGNVFHVGNSSGDGQDLVPDLMNGVVYYYATRYTMSDLDLAFLADFGIGTVRSDILKATAGADNIAAGGGNDIIRAAGTSADVFNGDAGSDTVIYAGSRSAYGNDWKSDGSISVSKGGATDSLFSIERIRFDDGDLIFDIGSSNGAAAYRLYGGAFDRTPDEGGLRFWIDQWLDTGRSLKDAAAQFIGSAEFVSLYGTGLSNQQYVDQLYLNVLHRAGESAGTAYWYDYLANHRGDRADVLVQFTQLAEFVGNSAANISDGYWVTPDTIA